MLHDDGVMPVLTTGRWAAAPSGGFALRTIRLLAVGFAFALLAAGLVYAYWAGVEHRLTVVTPGRVFQSAEMPPGDLVELAQRLGIQTVFDFRDDPDHEPRIAGERAALEEHGIRYVHLPSSTRPSQQAVTAFVRAMQAELAERRTVLLHCHDGEGRAVFFAAVYHMEFEGWDNARAYNATTRLPPSLMFMSKALPFLGRLSARNPKTPLILDYRRLAKAQIPAAIGSPERAVQLQAVRTARIQ